MNEMETKTNDSVEIIKCPNCGASDTTFTIANGRFRCHYCGKESEPDADGILNIVSDLDSLNDLDGQHFSPGMGELRQPEEEVVSFRCPSCKAEMSVETRSNSGSLTCHWCRHTISVANKINNGVRPDCLIPFTVSKRTAEYLIRDYLSQYRKYADLAFISTFRTDMIKPVYLPYMLGDFHVQAKHTGKGAIFVRSRKSLLDEDPVYDYDEYDFERCFDLCIKDLMVEANKKYAKIGTLDSSFDSRNIVNSILPFDTTKIVDYDPKFLNGDYRAEFRDMSYDAMKTNIKNQCTDISVYNALKTMESYTSGYIFEESDLDFVGSRIKSVLCPIWLYSYMDKKHKLNYICVNGQTGETAACVPLNTEKLFFTAVLIDALVLAAFFLSHAIVF
jgi:ribosomal protein S27E